MTASIRMPIFASHTVEGWGSRFTMFPTNIWRLRPKWYQSPASSRIGKEAGLLLFEAKAHDNELENEVAGRALPLNASPDRKDSHETIGIAINTACEGLAKATSLKWRISRDCCYQMSNRFAWAWKLTELGLPVVLVYLGFLRADEMQDQGRPFSDAADWARAVRNHSELLFAPEVWERPWLCNGRRFVALIRSVVQPVSSIAD